MTRRRFPGGARLAVVLSAAVAAAIIVAVLASTGSAQPPTTLHLIARSQKHVGFAPHHRPHQGDRFGFGDKITGDDTGVDRGVCTFIDRKALCNVQARLSNGNLSLQGLLPMGRAKHLPIPVTGGTGNYDGARGTARVTQVSRNKTRITVSFVLP